MDRYELFMMEARDKLVLMRLIVKGTICIFENEASPLFSLGLRNGMDEAALGFDAIGSALSELRRLIDALLEEHRNACSSEDKA